MELQETWRRHWKKCKRQSKVGFLGNEKERLTMSFRCPKEFDKEAKKIFRRMLPKFKQTGKCDEFKFPLFTSLCENYSALKQAHDGMRAFPSLIQETQTIDIAGQTHLIYKEIPYLKIIRDLEASIIKNLKCLGLNDGVGSLEAADPMEKLMDKGKNGKNKHGQVR
jgi:phage terminase small subunit